jgi:hypothetical protein
MTDTRFSQHVSVAEDVLVNVVGGESVLLNLDSESYYGLDEVGTRMWQVLTESESIQEAYEKLLSEYDVEPDKLRADMSELIGKLLELGLVEVS